MKTSDINQTAIGMSNCEGKSCINEIIKETEDHKIIFSSSKFIEFLQELGIRKVKTGTEYELVVVKDFIVSRVTPSEVKGVVLKEVRSLRNELFTDYILNKTTLFSMKYLDAVKTIELKMHRDNEGESFFYYRNGVVKVTSTEIHLPIPYKEFKRLIWSDHILDREFDLSININLDPPVFKDFLLKLSNESQERFLRICTVLGYCLHDYKTSANSRAIIVNDEIVSSNPEGGSGKSLLVDALSKIRKTIFFDGKNFDPKANFAWQRVDASVRFIGIDDVKRGFNFEELFSIITSGFRNINRKNKEEVELSIEESPTIVITTNNIIKGGSGSFSRRQYLLDIYQYFNKNRTPLDEYSAPFFSGWDITEWKRFDLFMLQCVQLFLQKGVTECFESNPKQKELIRCTNQSFSEWIDDNIGYMTCLEGAGTVEMRDRFLHDTNQKTTSISDRRFTDYIKDFCRIYEYEYEALSNRRPRGFKIVKKQNQ